MPEESRPLLEFIDAVKSQGASDEFVVALLHQNGWSEKRIYQAFAVWYETRTGRPVPNGGGRIEAAKDAFFYLLAFITLGIWTIQLGALLFTAIDRGFPNPAFTSVDQPWVTRQMANAMASIIVAFPLFVLVSRGILRGIERQPERAESSVRKWLTYIALVIAASTVIGDVVTFLAYFLRGDLSTRFILKVLTVLVIAGGVFAYYLDSLQREKVSKVRTRSFGFAALAMVSLGIVVGFIQIGAPSVQRASSQDGRRLFDLSSLAQGLHIRWINQRQGFVLPATIQDVQKAAMGADVSIFDPVSGRMYEYSPVRGTSYRLCGQFSRADASGVPAEWQHSAGHYCFNLDASENVVPVLRAY
ncbi:MAG: hypothetical protein JO061_13900 [Acidobacteriaceae bacterium]|nr:hypothetical protein [Acidobacteriaceae bacterium]